MPHDSAKGIPSPVPMKHAAPGIEALAHERPMLTRDIQPHEAGAFHDVDLGHDKIMGFKNRDILMLGFKSTTTQGTFRDGRRDLGKAFRTHL